MPDDARYLEALVPDDARYLEALVPDAAQPPQPPQFPRITYSFMTSDVFVNTISTFQIWDKARNTTGIEAIAGKIEKAIPAIYGAELEIKGVGAYEWLNPMTGVWEEFALADFERVATGFYARYPDKQFQWRQTQGKPEGFLRLFRGTPFLQPRPPTDARDIVVYYGNIEVRSFVV